MLQRLAKLAFTQLTRSSTLPDPTISPESFNGSGRHATNVEIEVQFFAWGPFMNTDNWRTAAEDMVKERLAKLDFEARGRLLLLLAQIADENFQAMMTASYQCHCVKQNPKPNDYIGRLL